MKGFYQSLNGAKIQVNRDPNARVEAFSSSAYCQCQCRR